MKTRLLLLIALIISSVSLSQNANLDREYFNVSYVKLPLKPTLDESKRTFSSNQKNIQIKGYTKINNNATLHIDYKIYDTKTGNTEIIKHTHEKKDKDGNVISTSYTYSIKVSFITLANVVVNNSENSENGYKSEFTEKDTYNSSEYTSEKDANTYFTKNKLSLAAEYNTKHKKAIINKIEQALNNTYGYVPYTNAKEHFWILGNKKHPEYQKHTEAYQNLKRIFSNMKYNQSIGNIKTEVLPIIDYFESVVSKYQGPKKKMAKMRYASFYNIAKIFYFLDMPEKTKVYANKLIENGYDKSDGKYFNSISDKLIEKFKKNELTTRHFEVTTKNLSTNIKPTETVAKSTPKQTASGTKTNTIKNPNFYYSEGNINKDNKVAKNLISTVKNIIVATDKQYASFVEGDYITDTEGRITGQKIKYPVLDNLYQNIVIIWKNNTITEVKFGESTKLKLSWNNDIINNISIASRADFNFKINYNNNLPITATQTWQNGNAEIYNITYDDKNRLKSVKKFNVIKKKKNIKEEKSYAYTNDAIKTKRVIYRYENKNSNPEIYFNKEYIFKTLNNTSFSITTTDNTELNIASFDDKARIIKREIKNKQHGYIDNYSYTNNSLFKLERHCNNSNSCYENSMKNITIYTTDTSKSSQPNYEWRKGSYGLNSTNELVFETTEDGTKFRKKINGSWTDWKFFEM